MVYFQCKNKIKKCSRCYNKRLYQEFIEKNKVYATCKSCRKNMARYRKKYRHQLKLRQRKYYAKTRFERQNKAKVKRQTYPWKITLAGIKQRCYNPKASSYKNYGGRGIKCNITAEELKQLWYRDKAYEMDRPSIDRIDNDGHYDYGNCRYIELSENGSRRHSQSVIQLTLDNRYMKTWPSMGAAERQLKISHSTISKCCRGLINSAGNYKWVFANLNKGKING